MNDISVVILAAGEGTRMKSSLPKVLHKINGLPMLTHLLNTLAGIQLEHTVVVLGYKKDDVIQILPQRTAWVEQAQRLGTGHAVQQVFVSNQDLKNTVLVLCGDIPLLEAETVTDLIETHLRNESDITILSAIVDEPYAYGRIIRSGSGEVIRIVEEKDASDDERAVKEINSGIYCFNRDVLKESLTQIKPNNKQGEYYLTDVIDITKKRGGRVDAVLAASALEITGINSLKDLAWASSYANRKVIDGWMERGVTFIDPQSVTLGSQVEIGQDTIIYPFTFIEGVTTIGRNCELGPSIRISDSQLGDEVRAQFCVLNQAKVENGGQVAPFTHSS